MSCSLVHVRTADGITLHGLHFRARGRGAHVALLHIPGIWGNFYENPFVAHFGDFYPRHGYYIITGNTRDHDGGAMQARFDDCIHDIQSWLQFAADEGHRFAVLQGHSLGALKAVRYLQKSEAPLPVRALVLLSPFDNVALYSSGDERLRLERLAKVKAIAERDRTALVPKDVWDMWLLSAGTYMELVAEDGPADVFPFRRGTLSGSPASRIAVPTFAAIGGGDFAALPSPDAELKQLSALAQTRATVIEGAPHNFAEGEAVLLDRLLAWLGTVIP